MVLIPLALIALLYGVYYYFTRSFNYWKIRKVPGPEPVPLFGNCFKSALRRQYLGDVFKDAYDQFPDAKVVGVYRMTTPSLVVRDLDLVKQMMIKDFDVFSDRGVEFSKEGLGANLFHADGETWRLLRNRFTPLFTSGKLKNMLYLMTNGADAFLDHVNIVVSQEPVQEIRSLVQKYTISTISACAFGIDMDYVHKEDDMMQRISAFDKLLFEISLFMELDMMYPGILTKLNASLFPKDIINFFYDVVRKVIHARNNAPIGRKDFMDLILEMRQQGEIKGMYTRNDKELHLDINEDVIAAQAFVFYVAGYETSATTMTYMLYELARNPDIQEKLQAEIDYVLKKYEGKITYESTNELKYMEQVFDETLRLYPVVDVLQRRVETDYKFPGLDLTIEKGQICLVTVAGIHYDAKYYPNPEKFDPDRFTPENAKNRHPCAHIPFGTGPRNCIGLRFAKLQIRICMARLLSKFRVEMTDRTPKKVLPDPKRIILSPSGGMHLKIVPRS